MRDCCREAEPADWKLVASEYDEMLRVALSIKTGRMLPSSILRRFGGAARSNRLARAVRELGRVIRTTFLLEYLDDLDLRETIQTAMNKSERFNQFTQFITFGGHGLIAENDRGEQRKRVKYTHLVANCLILHNAWALTEAIRKLRREGMRITPEVISRLSPYLTEHINRFGTYRLKPGRPSPPPDFAALDWTS
jgi:TnpA family transposase